MHRLLALGGHDGVGQDLGVQQEDHRPNRSALHGARQPAHRPPEARAAQRGRLANARQDRTQTSGCSS